MAKKRSCRRTEDENKIHEKAVKMRKMTDEQLVHYVEDRVNKAYAEGCAKSEKEKKPAEIDWIAVEAELKKIRSIGDAKAYQIIQILKKFFGVPDGE